MCLQALLLIPGCVCIFLKHGQKGRWEAQHIIIHTEHKFTFLKCNIESFASNLKKKISSIWKPKMFQSVYFLYKFCRFCSSQVHIRYSVMLHHWWPLLVINVCFVKRKNVQTRITFTKSISKMEFIFWKKNKVRTRCMCKQSGLGDYYTLHYSSI